MTSQRQRSTYTRTRIIIVFTTQSGFSDVLYTMTVDFRDKFEDKLAKRKFFIRRVQRTKIYNSARKTYIRKKIYLRHKDISLYLVLFH